ncbi:hypothetical protein RB628_21380 [Streptomyces sp. ADMS]|uniref:hypothetical protein n=1 Tax=Streptomyces sp. ADMS TaxID=3071415 RepID=UPI00296F2828|nr:hypothetical protein [Streptomyces sp. ADMS]MDW4907834.1 hypothetical protein [Streptomyces sp. ADMS]
MAMVTGRASAVCWAHGAVIALLAALAVLIHHETAAITAPRVQHATPSTQAGHAMPGMASSSAAAVPQGPAADHTDTLDAPAPSHGVDGSACADPGMQHCTTASVDTVKLAPPPQRDGRQAASAYQAKPGRLPAGTISRAPPDLSVLSQLRI